MQRLRSAGDYLKSLVAPILIALNLALLLRLFFLCYSSTSYAFTIDILSQIFIAELAGWTSIARSTKSLAQKVELQKVDQTFRNCPVQNLTDESDGDTIGAIAIVVGWREDEELFENCLNSYKAAKECKFLIVGIDGDDAEDMAMVDVYEKVYPQSNCVIHFDHPLGEILESYDGEKPEDYLVPSTQCGTNALLRLCTYVENQLREQILPNSLESLQQICVHQPHRCKKDILFSGFVVGLVISDILGLKYLWSSDSDSIIFPNTLQRTLNIVHSDPKAGGASAKLKIANKNPTIVAKMIASKYWFDQDVARAQTAACKASECQPGPAAAFRIDSLKDVIIPWYRQRIFGKKMVTNEDRHLTTNLLHRGWRVHYVADALVLTDAPSTILQWLKQQVRWGRGTHIERLERPAIYLRKCPLFGFYVLKEQFLPILGAYCVIDYLVRGKLPLKISARDVSLRLSIQFFYTLFRSHHPASRDEIIWTIPSLLLGYLACPGIHIWSLLTAFESSWGTTMRSPESRRKKDSLRERWYQVGFHIIWMTILVGFWTRALQVGLAAQGVCFLSDYFVFGSMIATAPLLYWILFRDLYTT